MSENTIDKKILPGEWKGDMTKSERITSDSRYNVVTDQVPLYAQLELQGLIPPEEYTREAIVQRSIQLHSPFFRVKSTQERPLEETPYEDLPIGLEDKLLDRRWTAQEANAIFRNKGLRALKVGRKFTAEDTVHFFAHEGAGIRQRFSQKFPGYEGIIDKLAETGKIYNTGSEIGEVQIKMLLELNHELGVIVGRLNAHPDRTPGNLSYDLRDKVYRRIRQIGVRASMLIDYSDGERRLAIPKLFSGQLLNKVLAPEDASHHDTGFFRIEPGADLAEILAKLPEQERKDWLMLRNAAFLLNDPLVRAVLDTYERSVLGGNAKQTYAGAINRYIDQIRPIVKSQKAS